MTKSFTKFIIILIVVLTYPAHTFATKEYKPYYWNVQFGIGGSYYINKFESVPSEYVRSFYPAISTKIYWRSPYRLQLGVEFGYFPIYHTNALQFDNNTPIKSTSSTSAIPLFISTDMRIAENWYTSIGIGPALLIHSTTSMGNTVNATMFSAANYSLSVGYLKRIRPNIALGGELGYMYIGKSIDNQVSLRFSVIYKFLREKK